MPGRGYLQVGNDTIELIQVAWTGDSAADLQPADDLGTPKFFDVVVNLARELAERPLSPWPPTLSRDLSLTDDLLSAYVGGPHARGAPASSTVKLNPALADWLAGEGTWPGVDWSTQAMRAV